jgi:hypothetical protein
MGYKTISWTIKNEDIKELLKQHCSYSESPQGYIRDLLHDAGLVSKRSTQMLQAENFPVVPRTLKLSLYTSDWEQLKAAADKQNMKLQELLEMVLIEQLPLPVS